MKGRLLFGLILIGCIIPFSAFSQSNERIDELIDQDKTDYALAVYMVLAAGGYISEDVDPQEAVETLSEQSWRINLKKVEKPIKLGDYSFLIMKALDIKGGIMYSLFPGPRYATRELYFKGIIREDFSACRTLSGTEALRMLRLSLEYKESRA